MAIHKAVNYLLWNPKNSLEEKKLLRKERVYIGNQTVLANGQEQH
jgi:hypothetical protein